MNWRFGHWSPWRGPRPWAAIFLGETKLELAVARIADGQVEILRQSTVDLASDDVETPLPQRWQAAARVLRAQLDPQNHRIVTAISGANVFCTTLQLPATDPAELRQMLELQIDHLTPLPLEEVVYSFEPLAVTDGQTRVLVAIAPKSALDERIEAIESAGLPPEIVTVDVLAVFRSMLQQDRLPRDEKLNALVLLSPSAANVVVHSAGAPLAVRSIRSTAGPWESSEAQTVLWGELHRTMLGAGVEHGRSEIGRLLVLAETDQLRPVAESMARESNGQAGFLDGDAGAALTLCREVALAPSSRLNLLPAEWILRRQAAKTRRNLIQGAIAAGGVYVLALVIFLAMLAARQTRLRGLESQIKRLQPDAAAVKQLRGEVTEMERQLDESTTALEVLRDVSVRLPENVKMTNFDYHRNQTVALRGQSRTTGAIYDFIKGLEETGLFSNVKTVGNMKTLADGLTTFELLCTFKTAPGGAAAAHGT